MGKRGENFGKGENLEKRKFDNGENSGAEILVKNWEFKNLTHNEI